MRGCAIKVSAKRGDRQMTATKIAELANELEAHVISQMTEEGYKAYMSMPREKRVQIVINAMRETAAALK